MYLAFAIQCRRLSHPKQARLVQKLSATAAFVASFPLKGTLNPGQTSITGKSLDGALCGLAGGRGLGFRSSMGGKSIISGKAEATFFKRLSGKGGDGRVDLGLALLSLSQLFFWVKVKLLSPQRLVRCRSASIFRKGLFKAIEENRGGLTRPSSRTGLKASADRSVFLTGRRPQGR